MTSQRSAELFRQAQKVLAGGLPGPLALPDSDLSFRDHEGVDRIIFLPAVSVAPGGEAAFWIAASGASYTAQPGQTAPDFSDLAPAVMKAGIRTVSSGSQITTEGSTLGWKMIFF